MEFDDREPAILPSVRQIVRQIWQGAIFPRIKRSENCPAGHVGLNQGVPPRSTCVFCHSRAGGDDNVKHGDISTRMGFAKATDPAADPAKYLSRSEDVHMGYDPVTKKGGDMKCVACHQVKKDASGNMIDHGIGGFMYHSVDEGVMKDCTDCHGSVASIHAGSSVERVLNSQAHARLACQVCHIPAFARKVATYVDWKWSLAGQDARPAACAAAPTGVAADGVTQRGTYAKMKGCFTWGTNARPVLRFYDGKWNRVIVGLNNAYTTTPVDLGSPSASYRDPAAKIYPFKKMTGNQIADTGRKLMLIPHLYGAAAGPNAYWSKYDWLGSLADASAYLPAYNAGSQSVVADYGFVDTVMLLKVDHEIAPKEQAFGMDGDCADCHFSDQIDWPALGWTKDPTAGGEQTLP